MSAHVTVLAGLPLCGKTELLLERYRVKLGENAPGAALCARHHQKAAAHCAQHSAPAGPAVGAAQPPMADACPLAGPCSASAPALPAGGSIVVATVAVAAGDVSVFAAPHSFHSIPPSPPPQG